MARREINAKTDILFDYQEIKEGRKVVALRFTIARNARADTPDPLRDDPRLARLVARLSAHGMAEEAARAIVQTHEPELVEWATTDLARRLKGKEKIDNPAGWLRKAIEEDWRPQAHPILPGAIPGPRK
ncbi:RepB family plasmid replication initiator protein [Magnetospirillum sp. SS-4]|uniref:RepB family plasmid replication initiator protein n=1 Tax=Magnetospirillum sp. SS-4 TaxID=2681465 RepID=UPI0020C5AF70|nr:RepB family plasmid replication initiator protein [Magnetospirillum sp. SS-4]